MRTRIHIWHAVLGGRELSIRGSFSVLLYNSVHASPRIPCVAIQLYSAHTAIHYIAIHRYTLEYFVYNLYASHLSDEHVAPALESAVFNLRLASAGFTPPSGTPIFQ